MSQSERAQEAKFVPAFFLPVVEKGESFPSGQFPQHVTLFPPLELPYDSEFGARLRREFNHHHPFTVHTGSEAFYGPDGETPVRLIEPSLSLQGVHYLIERAVGDTFHDKTYRHPYSPHVSVERFDDLPKGAEIFIAGLSIVEKHSGGEWTVVDKIGLKGEIA